ncbi:MAG: uracil-DNA glycosylase family protein [Tannerellaceae bacterium]|jgi:G:T/U-mismatch repair DNA glycosylase|nr:uracil-DNA glycosylase family protein [Tannerellaceae bacterium]
MLVPQIEKHPFPPFYPDHAKWLFLGSFPAKPQRWSMDFFYPNFQNDMWRIFGLVFFKDKNYFVNENDKSFNKESIIKFLTIKHIAMYDMAEEVIRHKDNASDNDLEIVKPLDIIGIITTLLPDLQNIVTTGGKSIETLIQQLRIANIDVTVPKIGTSTSFSIQNRDIRIYRMPSSSRAYPLRLEQKAIIYNDMFSLLFQSC